MTDLADPDPSPTSSPAPAPPLARKLRGWPANPPKFDSLQPEPQAAPSAQKPVGIGLPALIDRLTDCHVRAARNDSPDLMAQLAMALKRPVDTVICSIMDVDPAACVQGAWASAHADDLVAGVAAIGTACGASRRILALDGRSPAKWWNRLRSSIRTIDRSIRIVELENDYPQADPSLLLYTIVNRRLKPGRLPTEQGVVLLDAVAAIAVGAAAVRGQPMQRLPVCVRDHDRADSYFMSVPAGLSVREILQSLDLLPEEPAAQAKSPLILRHGDVLRDLRIEDARQMDGSEVLLHVSTAPRPLNPDGCIRCGWCFDACPTRIQPANLLEAAQREDVQLGLHAGLGSCIECGICTYVCPSRLPLLSGIRDLRRHERTLKDNSKA